MKSIFTFFGLLAISFTASAQTLKLDQSPTLVGGYYEYKNPTLNGKGFLAFDYRENYDQNDQGLLSRAKSICVALGHSEAKVEPEHLLVLNSYSNESVNQYLYVIQNNQPVEVFATWKAGNDMSFVALLRSTFIAPDSIYYSGRFAGLKCK